MGVQTHRFVKPLSFLAHSVETDNSMNISNMASDLTSGRCHMFISRSWVCYCRLNAPEMNAAVHRFMFIDFVFPARLNLAGPPLTTQHACISSR